MLDGGGVMYGFPASRVSVLKLSALKSHLVSLCLWCAKFAVNSKGLL